MPDTDYNRVIGFARDKAQFGFLALMQRAIQDAEKNAVERSMEARSGIDQTALNSVHHFLRQDGTILLRRTDTLFRNYLERAMQTMYIDLRPGMRKLSAGELSLIDDEVVNHQIEVGRLAHRMREANEESIGRLNVIVAQLHDQHEAKERENPFRPYLLARALYEGVRETAADEAKGKLLFEHLANALIEHLPGYYAAIREAFEASGVHGKFVIHRSKAAHHQRYFGAVADDRPTSAQLNSRIMPGLQRLLETLQGTAGAISPEAIPAGSDQPKTAQDLVRMMFSPSTQSGSTPAAPGDSLVVQLTQYQQMVARQPAERQSEAGRLSVLREKMDLGDASPAERMTVEVVAMLFEFILDDEQIPPDLRQHIGRLQVPILKAAVLEPNLMHDERHPARQLLNRLSTAVVAADPASASGGKLAFEIERVVDRILDEFDTDTAIFSSVAKEFEQFLADHLRRDDVKVAEAIETVEAAEKFSILLTNTTKSLCEVLLPLSVDKRISDFIIAVWPHVLVHAAWHDVENKLPSDHPGSLFNQYRALLPDLLWSIAEKQDAQQRSAMIRLLPDLVKRLRMALQLIQLPAEDSKEIMDLLVEIHTQILRGAQKGAAKALPALEELRRDFARVAINWERVSWGLSEPPQPRAAVIEEVFAKRQVAAELNLGLHNVSSTPADREFLAQTYLLGTRVEFRSAGSSPVSGQLVWVSTHRSLYLFRQDANATLVVYTFASLLEALRDETLVPVEYAPVFERAVESLLFGAETLQPASS